MAKRPPLRLAIAGAGLIGRAHIERIRSRDDCTLVALADPSPAAAGVAKEEGVALHTDIDTMLRSDGIVPRRDLVTKLRARHRAE